MRWCSISAAAGAARRPDAADIFIGGAPDMTMIFRNGERDLIHARWRKPMVAIIDEGTRSGMEIFAHALKSNGVKLIGAPTAGDVVAGRGYVLPDDSLLDPRGRRRLCRRHAARGRRRRRPT